MDANAESGTLPRRTRRHVLGMPMEFLGWSDALGGISHWSHRNESRIICVCDVDSIAYALRNPAHREAIAAADMVTPDGAAVAWLLRRKAHRAQGRINEPDLMLACC